MFSTLIVRVQTPISRAAVPVARGYNDAAHLRDGAVPGCSTAKSDRPGPAWGRAGQLNPADL